jgi:hypothetical protein
MAHADDPPLVAAGALISLTASPYTVLMPIFARDVFLGARLHSAFWSRRRLRGRDPAPPSLPCGTGSRSLGRIAPVSACIARRR